MTQRYIYVVFSSTPYRMGRFIQSVTRSEYNHVSISLRPDLQQMYGFARRYYKTPFYGGFVCESPSRYCPNGVPSRILVCKVPVTQQQFDRVNQHIHKLLCNREHYLYNHLSVMATPLRVRIPVKDAYVCVEFCAEILHLAGLPVDPKKYHSIKSLCAMLSKYKVYKGPMESGDIFDEAFFVDKPLAHPIYTSLRSIAALIPRVGRR